MIKEFRNYIFKLISNSEKLSGVPTILTKIRRRKDEDTTDKQIEDNLREKGLCIIVDMGVINPEPVKTSVGFLTFELTVPVIIEENAEVNHNSESGAQLDIEDVTEEILKTLLIAIQGGDKPASNSFPTPSAEVVPISEYAEGRFTTVILISCKGRLTNA